MTKKEKIKQSLVETKAKRNNQICRVYEVKIDKSHCNKKTQQALKMLFIEAKWLYNHCLALEDSFSVDSKINEVIVKIQDKYETRIINYLSSQMKQSIIERLQDNIKGLSKKKQKGRKIGRIRFKSEINSIPLKQYGNTYKLINNKYIKIQGVKQAIKVNGVNQIQEAVEYANAVLIARNGDYYIAITTYKNKDKNVKEVKKVVGIDFGIAKQLVLSSGVAIQYQIPINKRLRKLHKRLSRKKVHSKSWYKTKRKLNKRYNKINNIKKDIRNKIVGYLVKKYEIVCFQNENIKSWQRIWGRKILNTSIGGIISMLKNKIHTPIEINRFVGTTKMCSKCGSMKHIELWERTYSCSNCGLIIDRDLNSAINMVKIGMGYTELTPMETKTNTLAYFSKINYVKASLVA